MVKLESNVDVDGIRNLYDENEAAQAVMDHFASRERNWGRTTVERLQHNVAMEGHDLSRGQIVNIFKELENFGCGRFVPGRWSYPSRFEWDVGMVGVGKAAAGEPVEEFEQISPNESGEEEEQANSQMIRHLFNLRPNLQIRIELPRDLTRNEAERLASFLASLPFE